MSDIESRTINKLMWRLIPFLILCYFVAFLDRVNVGFAKLQMNAALGLSDAAYGLGAGLFFVGYFFFEVPSNLLLERFGARRWIARIMITWGIVSGLFAFIPHISAMTGFSSTTIFYFLRLLLGAFEAGFFPGIIFYLTLWFPSIYRARVISLFMLAIPISNIVGSPISGFLLTLHGGGLDGWQWLFVIEAIPSVLVGCCVLMFLTDFPHQARWLQQDEIAWLQRRLDSEKKEKESAEHFTIIKAMTDSRILLCSAIYFCHNAATYGIFFFMPTIIKGFGFSEVQTGFLAAVPFIFGAIGMVLFGRHSDRTVERKRHVAAALLLVAIGLGFSGLVPSAWIVLALLCVAVIGSSSIPPMFWPMPASILTGASAAAGIAAINSIGNLAGFVGPYVMGSLRDATGGFTVGLIILASCAVIGALLSLRVPIDAEIERHAGKLAVAAH
mgnify:CR=1 FL=1